MSVIDDLRAKVRAIERPIVTIGPTVNECSSKGWTLGVPKLDAALSGGGVRPGLDCSGVHEIKPSVACGASDAAGWAAAIGFGLRLAVRRREAAPAIVWCWPKAFAHELGHLYGPGLAALGLDPSRFVVVETARTTDALWAMEEALKSGAAGLVIGVMHDLDLLEARRLSLACQTATTPCLLLSHGARPSAAATATRWRIAARPSAPHPLVASLPGVFAVQVAIERCRLNPVLSQSVPQALEWCDEAHRFRVPATLADRASGGDAGAHAHQFADRAFKGRAVQGGER